MFRAIFVLAFLSVALAGAFKQRYVNPFGYHAHPEYRAYYQQSFRPYPARQPFYNNYYSGAYPYESFDGYDPYIANVGGNFRFRPYFANNFQHNPASPAAFYPRIPNYTNRGFGGDVNGHSPLQFVLNDQPVQPSKPANLFTAFQLDQLNRQAGNAPQTLQEVPAHISAGQPVTTDDVAVIAILPANPSPLGADSVATLPDSIDAMAAIDENLYVVIDDDQPAAGVQAMHVLQKDTPSAPIASVIKQEEFPLAVAIETEEQAAAEKEAQLSLKEAEADELSTTITTEPATVTEVTSTSTAAPTTESTTVTEATTTTTTAAPLTESTTVTESTTTTTTANPITESTTVTEAQTTAPETAAPSSEVSTSPPMEASTNAASAVATLNEDVPATKSEELVRRSVSVNVDEVPHKILINGYSEQGSPMTILFNRKH